LAWAELYLVLGNLFRQFDMKLYQTTSEAIAYRFDFFGPLPDTTLTKGVWVEVVKAL
jgi:hypothetical protein